MKDLFQKLKEGNSSGIINDIKESMQSSVFTQISERESEMLEEYKFQKVNEEETPEDDNEDDDSSDDEDDKE